MNRSKISPQILYPPVCSSQYCSCQSSSWHTWSTAAGLIQGDHSETKAFMLCLSLMHPAHWYYSNCHWLLSVYVCVCVCVCVCERVCVCVFCMHTAHHTWGSGYRSGPVFFKSECPWIGDLKFQLPGVGFSVSEFQSHINALRCSGGSECAGVRCVLHRVLQPGWCSNPRERARQRDCDRKMESKKKTPDKQSGRERTSESPLVWSVALRVGDFEL